MAQIAIKRNHKGTSMAKKPASARVVQVVEKGPDLECHLRVVEVEGVKVVELRDYIPSLKTYGRGYWMPLEEAKIFSIINGLTEISRSGEL
jgi:hypothetical protein